MILLSCSFLLWSVFFFPLFLPDAMPEHSELIDGDPGLGVYWESKNSFIRNDARLYCCSEKYRSVQRPSGIVVEMFW